MLTFTPPESVLWTVSISADRLLAASLGALDVSSAPFFPFLACLGCRHTCTPTDNLERPLHA